MIGIRFLVEEVVIVAEEGAGKDVRLGGIAAAEHVGDEIALKTGKILEIPGKDEERAGAGGGERRDA